MTGERTRRKLLDRLAFTGSAGVLALLILLAALGLFSQRAMWADQHAATMQAVRAEALQQAAVAFVTLQRQVELLTGDTRPVTPTQLAAAAAELRTRLAAVHPRLPGAAARDDDPLLSALDAYGNALLRLPRDAENLMMPPAVTDGARRISEQIQADLRDITRHLAYVSRPEESAAATALFLMAPLALAGMVMWGLAVWLARRQSLAFNREISALSQDLGRVFTALAEGDLTQKLDSHYHGGFQKLADDVNATVEKLAGMVARINGASTTIANAAAEVAAGGSDLAERTERQAASLEQTAAALEQLANNFKLCSDRAQQANIIARDARKSGEHGVTVLTAAIADMQRIVEASEKIKDIIRVTEEISRRTNMLALNAAVEAARAGEAGKGFGVVAREVGSLAERSSQASQQIKDMILNSEAQILQGVRMVTQSGEALQAIVSAVDRASVLFGDIAVSIQSQADMMRQINVAMTQIDESTQMNAALSEQTCAASQSMRQEATGLKELVSFFMLDPASARNELGRHIVLIESTKLDHVSFMKRIREAIAGLRDTTPDEVPDHHQCRLGKWYDTIDIPAVRQNPVFRTLERPHAQVHENARNALRRHAVGDPSGCDQALKEMEHASAQVLGLIDELAADLRSHDANAARQAAAGAKPHTPPAHQAAGKPAGARPRGVLRHAGDAKDPAWAEF